MANAAQIRDVATRGLVALSQAYPAGGTLAACAAGVAAMAGLDPVAVGGLVIVGSAIEQLLSSAVGRKVAKRRAKKAGKS